MSGFLLDEMFVFLPLPDASVPAAQPAANSDTRERLFLEILGGMEAGPPKRIGGFVDLLSEYHAAPAPAIRAVLQSWLASGSPGLAATALRGLRCECLVPGCHRPDPAGGRNRGGRLQRAQVVSITRIQQR